jgi:NAD(P)H-hydrate epimerase
LVGRLEVAGIGLPADLNSLLASGPWLATPDVVRKWLPPRPRNAHKGTFGRVLIIGGSINYPGAPILAGQGAYRAGAGLVTLAVPGTVYGATVSMLPEATWIVLPEDLGVISADGAEILLPETAKYESLVIGPGFGREKTTTGFLKELLQEHLGTRAPLGFGQPEKAVIEKRQQRSPWVIDADALKILAEMEGWPGKLPPGSVLTPHPGEMSILCGISREEILKDRAGIALRFAREWNLVVVLKGAFTVIASPDGTQAISPFATSALARAGTGDVLAGVIGGLIAQGMKGFEAAVLGVFLHGRAGEIAAEKIRAADSVLAGDVARAIADSIAELRQT